MLGKRNETVEDMRNSKQIKIKHEEFTTEIYVEQFERCLEGVLEEEAHLVDSKVNEFMLLSQETKSFYIRLFLRKHGWIRIHKCNYYRLADMIQYATTLERMGYINMDGPIDMAHWVDLLVKEEILEILQNNGGNTRIKGSRANIVELVLQKDELFPGVMEKCGAVMRLDDKIRLLFQKCFVVFERLQKWPDQDAFMSTSILSNLVENSASYMKTNIKRIGIVWPTIADLDDYVAALRLEHQIDALVNEKEWLECERIVDDIIPVWKNKGPHVTGIPWFTKFTGAYIHTRILHKCASALLSLKRHDKCIDLLKMLLYQNHFCSYKRGKWYDELAKISERYDDIKSAKLVCLEALSDTWVQTHHRESIIKRLKRLYKGKALPPALWDTKYKESIPERVIKATRILSESTRVLIKGEIDTVTVEEYALEHFKSSGFKGVHSENSFIGTLFGILFWDVIFDDTVPGVFHSPFQAGPLDFRTEYFYEARQEAIHRRLQEIYDGKGIEIIERVYDEHYDSKTIAVGVSWNTFTCQDLSEIYECITGPKLSAVFQQYTKSMWAYSGGVPDLCLWNPTTLEFQLVEVKSVNDVLSQKQIEWLQYLKSCKISVLVLHIKY